MNDVILEIEAVLGELCAKGGPDDQDYDMLDEKIRGTYKAVEMGAASPSDILAVLDKFPEVFSIGTLQGMALQKPHGYAGDYEMIEKIYACHVSDDQNLRNWDRYFQSQHAPKAVRNRKSYFHRLLDELPEGSTVLKLGVGPGRGMFEWLERNPRKSIYFECVDVDKDAIEHARSLNLKYADKIVFHHASVFKFIPGSSARYDLIWAAGLFDYFDDRAFVALGSRFFGHLAEAGELVIGNFSPCNPTRPYMELFGNWKLNHRSADSLHSLAIRIGADPEHIRVGQESEGVNLFLHVEQG